VRVGSPLQVANIPDWGLRRAAPRHFAVISPQARLRLTGAGREVRLGLWRCGAVVFGSTSCLREL